ncbi:MAG: ATP-binding cassette domain-containing protein [Proteobacteria bacterium]|nr:ATP-binding cassette domain-containing protein [Pseudomonadota bacterium]
MMRKVQEQRTWPGLIPLLEGWHSKLSWLSTETTCRTCRGGRLTGPLLAVRCFGLGIAEFTALNVAEALQRLVQWQPGNRRAKIADRAILELRQRLSFLVDVGLGYLELDRGGETLSGGEAQRIRLASQIGSGLTGVIYVLDEPTIGLHPRDTRRLIGTLHRLRDLGNTVIVVEHDPDTIVQADHIVDLGPGAGIHGGNVIGEGTPQELVQSPESVTGRWLGGVEAIGTRPKNRRARSWVKLLDPRGNNLRCGDVAFPLGLWIGVAGVSGSGKSTLVMDTLAPALQQQLGHLADPLPHGGLRWKPGQADQPQRVVLVDQSPIGRNPRSTAATYCNIFTGLRQLFAGTSGARERGWKPGRFSFNTADGGRCTTCEGRGATLVEMHFLPDVWVTCPQCRGHRYDRQTLEVRFKGRSIADALALRADEALSLFANIRNLAAPLRALVDVGLGYLTLGQPANTLSGGEAQRVKLASELVGRRKRAFYILDEPTTGLHLADISTLVTVLHRLVDEGHTVVTIEHHPQVLAQADWIIDLGPEGGAEGGLVIAQGNPREIKEAGTPTGLALP